jgi:hypothetical protein
MKLNFRKTADSGCLPFADQWENAGDADHIIPQQRRFRLEVELPLLSQNQTSKHHLTYNY